ncbi:MAG TPA: redoxin domain-containing protein [Burkholderiales bacterium]|nr:redoxin domain-containing protein [Burkholderiales bacterium]
MKAPIQPGERAPEFSLAAINREGVVSAADYRGRAVMIGFFRGLHCPFCRRQIAQLGAAQPTLATLEVETLAVINTPLERARLYFRYRPTPVTLLSDPECETHQAFGIPRIEFVEPGGAPAKWPRTRPGDFAAARIDPTGELGAPTQPMEANTVLNRKDGFELDAADKEIFERHGTQFAGQFLIDREGIARWSWTEAPHSPNELCRFPSAQEMLEAAQQLNR